MDPNSPEPRPVNRFVFLVAGNLSSWLIVPNDFRTMGLVTNFPFAGSLLCAAGFRGGTSDVDVNMVDKKSISSSNAIVFQVHDAMQPKNNLNLMRNPFHLWQEPRFMQPNGPTFPTVPTCWESLTNLPSEEITFTPIANALFKTWRPHCRGQWLQPMRGQQAKQQEGGLWRLRL